MAGVFNFATSLFAGAPPRPDAVNENLGGDELAAWLVSRLKDKDFAASDFWAEDHGYDFDIRLGGRRYLVVCARDFDEEKERPGHHWIVVDRLRSFIDVLFFRGRLGEDDEVIRAIDDILRADRAIRVLTYSFER